MMASCMALPREGHLDQLFRMFAYLKNKHNSEMVFDPLEPEIDLNSFEKKDWKNTVYGEEPEEIPANVKQPCGFGFKIRVYVDSDHAGDSVTCWSRSTGFLIYLNSAPISFTSKKQTSIETSSFGSEFIAMKLMMGIPCEGVSKDEWRTTYINTHDNLADLFTKPLAGGEK